MKGKHPIDEQLYDRFREMESLVPEQAWDRIAADLDGRRQRRIIAWSAFSLMGAAVLIGLVFCWLIPCGHGDDYTENIPVVLENKEANQALEYPPVIVPSDLNHPEQIESAQEEKSVEQILSPLSLNGKSEKALQRNSNIASGINPIALNSQSGIRLFDWKTELPVWLEGINSEPAIALKETNYDHDKKVQWYLGLHANTGALDQNLSALKGFESFINKSFFDILTASENNTYQLNYGLDLAMKFRNGLMFSTGFSTSHRQQDFHYRYSITEFPVVDRAQGIVAYLPLAPVDQVHVDRKSSNTQYLLEVPLQLEYSLIRMGKFSSGLRSGTYLGYAFEPRGLIPDETTLFPEDLTKKMRSGLNVAAHIGVTLNYEAGNRFLLSVEPAFIKNLTGLNNKEAYIQSNPGVRGINLRLLYKLNP